MRFASVLAVALYSTVSATGADAQTVLTFDQALRRAQDRSRQLIAQDYAAASAREMAVAAGQLPDPTLTAGINNLPINGPDRFSLTRDFMTMRSVGVMQQFTRADKRNARAARYEREAESAVAGRTVVLADLQRDTALAWLDRYYQERILEVLVAQRNEARLQIEAADAAYRGGRGSQVDVFLARSAMAQVEDRIAQAEQQIEVATTRLARRVGPEASLPLGPPPETGAIDYDVALLKYHVDHNPQIELLLRQEQVARAEVDIAQANRRSDWSAELMYSQRGPAYSNMISINFSIPWQIDRVKRQDRELAAKLAQIDQLQAQREEATREHLAEALTWLGQWRSNRDRLVRYEDSLIPLTAERTRAALAAYRGNSASLSTVLEARRMEIDTRLERVRLEMENAGIWAKLEFLLPAGSVHRGESK
ncbi:MAG TPA: TolC family protein [Burkholderiaceae bacterium]|nr:TolC family protein [Burkholderiaceae bacterium]